MRRYLWWICGVVLAAAGCGGPANPPASPEEMKQTALSDVGELYRMYVTMKQKPPQKLTDFTPMEKMSPTGYQAVRSGDVVVRYGATLPDTGEEPGKVSSDEVLAYEKAVPESGGQVLMLNRTVRTMTADEFKAARLAGTTSSEPVKAQAKGKAK
jgi:hypothetical protein